MTFLHKCKIASRQHKESETAIKLLQ